jgi:tetratricopeptide (TPR) repeat protein
MIRGLKISVVLAFAIAMVFACSTEKNTLINRSYHGLTAHYNGYFNANLLIDQSMQTYRNSVNEDFYSILPIDLVPNEEEVIGMYPAIDTAIAKCTKVIVNHSMPSNDRPARKKSEHNRWIDENWITVGIASYYRRDYEGAMKNFKFVSKFYSNDPSLYVGELWMAKTNIATGDLTKAKFNLDNLDKALEAEEARSKNKTKKSKYGSKKKKKKRGEDIAKFPKKIRFDLQKTKADLALKRDNKIDAIKFLEKSLEYARKSSDKARVHFILGQLYEDEGNNANAAAHYGRVLKENAPFKMSFNARLKKAFLGNDEKTRKSLNKMLKDAKNAEFKDQIYYALAGIEFKDQNESKGVEYLHLCAFYSTSNTRQKGMAYEQLGDMNFSKRNYVSAQKYYDSCATVIDDNYPNAEVIRNKANDLASLVVAVETVQYEDSVQRIASLNEKDRVSFIKDLIKKIKEAEERRKIREAERLRELQANENLFVQTGSGSKWYWNNAKTRSEGFDEFKNMWGVRDNEDDWRRSDKTVFATFESIGVDSVDLNDTIIEEIDTLTVEYITSRLPLSDSALAVSNVRLLAAHYNAGIIYKEQLYEVKIAQGEFEAVLDKNIENEHNLMSAFQLYKIHKGSASALKYKEFILTNYSSSDYANYLRDPNYFVKKKERDALAEQEYVKVLERYNKGLYYPVISKADMVIENEKDNVFRAKYMLLKVLSTGQINENKQELLPTLNMVVEEYPGSSEAEKAQEMINIIENGYSKNEEVDFGNKFPFNYEDRVKLMVIVFPQENITSNMAKTKIVDFQREFFSRERIKVTSKVFGNDGTIILISEFASEADASEYIRVYKKTRKHLLDLQKAKIFMITNKNLKVLFEKQNLEVYENFYEEYY